MAIPKSTLSVQVHRSMNIKNPEPTPPDSKRLRPTAIEIEHKAKINVYSTSPRMTRIRLFMRLIHRQILRYQRHPARFLSGYRSTIYLWVAITAMNGILMGMELLIVHQHNPLNNVMPSQESTHFTNRSWL